MEEGFRICYILYIRDVLGEFGREVQRLEWVHVFLAIAGVCRVEKYAAFEELIADLLQRDRRTRDILEPAVQPGRLLSPVSAYQREKARNGWPLA